MKIAVCDDNKLVLKELEKQLLEIDPANIVSTFSDLDLLFFSLETADYDALLLDIDWQREQTGLDAAEKLYLNYPNLPIIYVTAYTEQFVQQVFLRKSNLCGYLMKPVDRSLLIANLKKAVEMKERDAQERLLIRTDGKLVTVPFRDILYIESKGHHIKVCTPERSLITYEKLGKIEEKLGHGFLRCHKSFLVNMVHIRSFRTSEVQLQNDELIPVSRSRAAAAKEAYIAYIGEMI